MPHERKDSQVSDEEGGAGPGPAPDGPQAKVEVTHANQLRSAKFKSLIRKPVSWISIGVVTLIGAGIAGAIGGPALGGAAFVVVALIGIVIVFAIADHQAEDAFYDAYCESHGLTRVEGESIGQLTPFLRKGDERETNEIFRGDLADGVRGDLVLYTYTEVSHDSKGNRNETDYPYTLVHVQMPEVIEHLPELRVQNKFGFKFLEGFEDKFRINHERVTLESEAIQDRFEIFVAKGQDEIWVRRLFSPSFIVWLTESPPKKFAFDLEDGHLVAYLPKHMDDVEGFEEVTRVGTYVARRLLEEVAETSPRTEREMG